MKTYTFYDDSWYDSGIGCDCCPGSWMEAYNSSEIDSSFGTAHSIDECYIQAIVTEMGGYESFTQAYLDNLYQMLGEELEKKAEQLGINVFIVS